MISLPEKFSAENLKGENTPSIIIDLQEDIIEAEKTLLVDWQANSDEFQVDYTPPVPDIGDVIIELITTEYQSNGDTWRGSEGFENAQGIQIQDESGELDFVDLYLMTDSGAGTINVYIASDTAGAPGSAISSVLSVGIADLFTGWVRFDFSAEEIVLAADTQYYVVMFSNAGSGANDVHWRVDFTGASYAYGNYWENTFPWFAYPGADAYFVLETKQYRTTGYITTDNLDLGLIPTNDGEWKLSDLRPDDSLVSYEAWSSTTGAFAGEEISLGTVFDGDAITDQSRYFRVKATFFANTDRFQTPTLQSIKADFTNFVTYSDNSDLGYEVAIKTISGLTTSIDTFKASTIGQMSVTLEHSETLSTWLATKNPKNKDAIIYAGFRAEGWTKQDHIQIFHGQIDSWSLSDKNLITIVVKDFQKEWSVDVPSKWESVADNVTYTGEHHIDVMLDILQNQINVRDSKIDLDSFAVVRAALSGWEVTRTITDNPEDAKKMMEELRVLTSSFFIPNADGSIRIKRFNSAETEIDSLNDNDFIGAPRWDANAKELRNRTLIYLDWDGNGQSASDFADADISADVTSQTDWGEIATHEIKDKWTHTAEKAAQITNGVAADILDRYADPPMTFDIVVDRKKIYYEPGDILKMTTIHAPSEDGSGIEDVNFQIVNKNLDFLKDTIKLKLLEV